MTNYSHCYHPVVIDASVIYLAERHGRYIVRGKDAAAVADTKTWIRVEFERGERVPWQEAYDQVPALLDVA